jgi:anhydro-N-acetylmuramic acid kinase
MINLVNLNAIMKTIHALGMMSGSSLDGLDLCYVRFSFDELKKETKVNYEILAAETIAYDNAFRHKLKNLCDGSAFEFAQMHTELGKYFGRQAKTFIQNNKIDAIDCIGSHGQTIFHQPLKGFTAQIGCGAQIAAITGIQTVCDFRTSDMANGGQGAPIIPVAEKHLFPEYNCFLNIGGIANISLTNARSGTITAYDVCAANTMLNDLAGKAGKEFDENGAMAASGTVIPTLLNALNALPYCMQQAPKSLGSEHIYADWITLLESHAGTVEDKLATAVEHIAMQVDKCADTGQSGGMLVTGGGALNAFLIKRIRQHAPLEVIVPDLLTVQYKEAMAMALLGVLRIHEIPTCLSSVTGATKDSIGGTVYIP